jgi:hypothetical protein
MEDENDLHSLWSALLAAALDPEADEVHRKYVSILADLTSPDATVLLAIWREWQEVKPDPFRATGTVSYGPGVRGTEIHDEASTITLNRLGLIGPNYTEIRTYLPAGFDGHYKSIEESETARSTETYLR